MIGILRRGQFYMIARFVIVAAFIKAMPKDRPSLINMTQCLMDARGT